MDILWKKFEKIYPLYVEQFEEFSPVDNETITDKMNKVIQSLNRIGRLSESVVKDWNKVFDWLMNEGLSEEVVKQLDKWKADGTFEELLNVMFDTINTKVDGFQGTLDGHTTRLSDIAVNVKTFGAKGDGITDDSQAIKDALSVSNNIYFPDGTYLISFDGNTKRTCFYEFVDKKNIRLTGKGAKILDGNTYTVNTITDIFRFIRCENIYVDVNCEALPLANPSDPTIGIGYSGSAFLYFEDNCKNIKVDSAIKHTRYGVRSGSYDTPSWGYCSNFDIRLHTYMVGYPSALYLAEDITVDINADGVHRAFYMAGVHDVRGKVTFKNVYIQAVSVLMTNAIEVWDAVIANQKARGCSNINLKVTDAGSTVFESTGHLACAGIALQFVAPTKYKNINIDFYVKGTNTVSTTTAGFHIYSTASGNVTIGGITVNYPYQWENFISLDNIKASGIIDRTEQTVVGNTSGELYIRTYDLADTGFTHGASVSNLVLENIVLKKGTGTINTTYIDVPNLQDSVKINNLVAKNINFSILAPNGKVRIANSDLNDILSSGTIAELVLNNSIIRSFDQTKTTKTVYNNLKLNELYANNVIRKAVITTDGTSTIYTLSGFLKDGMLTKQVMAVLPNYGHASNNWSIGITGTPAYFGTTSLSTNVTAGYNRFYGIHYPDNALPKIFTANTDLLITFGSAPTSGEVITVYVFEEEFMLP